MSTAQLHNLRLMTNLQDNQQNMIIFVLAGQKELGKRLESTALENLYQRIGVYCRIKGLVGVEAIQQYLAHRIQLCGGSPEIFTKEACQAIWTHSGGVPRLINKFAKLCLKAGETNQVRQIDEGLAQAVASMFEREKPAPVQKQQANELSRPRKSDHAQDFSTSASVPDPSPGLIQNCSSHPQSTLSNLDSDVASFIREIPAQLQSQIQQMEDKQLLNLAGKMAAQYIQKNQPKNYPDDPVILWDSVKGRLFSAFKLLRENLGHIHQPSKGNGAHISWLPS